MFLQYYSNSGKRFFKRDAFPSLPIRVKSTDDFFPKEMTFRLESPTPFDQKGRINRLKLI
ncbi:hypothetical protein HanXRQr2_Chr13g0572101 [Helianthus annuus]|uniref:Uncharacterized protein n=1 Tax=Helianthus annuus TaxID=4232 RepID=A0A9K3EF99_HELAN|nr:hypothetical protein HanXRQr2_Chr13g0572101 [Helianthus annuus]